MEYFARVSAGLEEVAWQEIAQYPNAELNGYGHRRVDFRFDGSPTSLVELRCVDDAYVFVALITGFIRRKIDLDVLQEELGRTSFQEALEACAAVRPIGETPRYSVTASFLGKRPYNRYDIENAVQAGLVDQPWEFRLNRPADPDEPEEAPADLDVRVLMEDDWALVGLRLSDKPLHRRPYKIASLPGSLKAPVAACLCQLAEIKPGDAVLDPLCGAGTILVEAASMQPQSIVIGGDLFTEALAASQTNLTTAGFTPNRGHGDQIGQTLGQRQLGEQLLYQGDARTLALPDGSIQAVVSNLPWNVQLSAGHDDISVFYTELLESMSRVLAAGGRAVLLTAQADDFEIALAQVPALSLTQSIPISLFGQHPLIYILHKAA